MELTMPLLEIKNLHVEVEGKKILNGLTLAVDKGQVAAITVPDTGAGSGPGLGAGLLLLGLGGALTAIKRRRHVDTI